MLALRSQILLALCLVTLFAVLSTGYLVLWASGNTVRTERESGALSLAAAAAGVAAGALDPAEAWDSVGNRGRLAGVLRLIAVGDILQASVIGANRRVLVSRPAREAHDVDPPGIAADGSGLPSPLHYRTLPENRAELLAYAPVNFRGEVAGAVRLVMAAETPSSAALRGFSWSLLALVLGDAFLALVLGVVLLTRLVARPLQDLERAAARVSAGDLDQHLTPAGPREIESLAAAFNRMTRAVAEQREQLIRTEKLASVGQLAAGVAHEIGNPLAAILGYVDILRGEVSGGAAGPGGAEPATLLSDAERRDALERVRGETQRIHRIIQELLAYSRPTQEEARPTDLAKVVDAAHALLKPQARFRGVEVQRHAVATWPWVSASPGRLTQVLVNLLLNAADAMDSQGRIDLSAVSAEGRARLTIADQGSGVPAGLERKIFDPFFTTKAPGRGTGLGLSICRSIVETYGGTLELEDTPSGERGARFVVTLPEAKPG